MNKGNKNSYKHGLSKTNEYYLWKRMKARCNDINHYAYKNYGGRGITVCEEWNDDPVEFCNWAKRNGYKKGLHLDRKNNDKGYNPENCRFVTPGFNNRIGGKRKLKTNTSGFTGVYYLKSDNRYHAFIYHEGKRYQLGSFKKIENAVCARINKEIELTGEQKTNLDFNNQLEQEGK